MAVDYEFEIFLSYRRVGNVRFWVQAVLAPELKRRLEDRLPGPVRLALDEEFIETGDVWPSRLSDAHARSKVFVVVLSANYFRSGWCFSEWRNAVDRWLRIREQQESRCPIIFPIRYNDLDRDLERLPESLRDEVRTLQIGLDFNQYTTLVNPRGDNDRALKFRDEIERLCEGRLCQAIENVPAADPNWPRIPAKPYTHDDLRWRSTLS